MPYVLESMSATTIGAPPAALERRRPGRPASVSPQLIPLLRNPAGACAAAGLNASPGFVADDLRDAPGVGPLAIRGIAFGLLLALPFWGVFWLVMRHLFLA